MPHNKFPDQRELLELNNSVPSGLKVWGENEQTMVLVIIYYPYEVSTAPLKSLCFVLYNAYYCFGEYRLYCIYIFVIYSLYSYSFILFMLTR